jgi:hypothetical protein
MIMIKKVFMLFKGSLYDYQLPMDLSAPSGKCISALRVNPSQEEIEKVVKRHTSQLI